MGYDFTALLCYDGPRAVNDAIHSLTLNDEPLALRAVREYGIKNCKYGIDGL